jgi:ATP-dependent Clp protease ATP-binding subunit ClpC
MDMVCAKNAWDLGDSIVDENLVIQTKIITAKDVAMVVSEQCQIPIEVIMWDDKERIKKIEYNLSKRVLGQKYAIDTVCRVLKNAYSGIRDPGRPIGSFVFGGQSGTGKTHMSKELANVVFGKESSLIRLDMSEFSESHSVSKLVGSPPGYVGFKETDAFIDKVKRKPYCIILMDEFEKAHPDVVKLFLQVMSDGIMTDAMGNKADFKNVILVMTGNFGMNDSKAISMGFEAVTNNTFAKKEQERLIQYCKEQYGAEFINRVDEFVPF